MLAAGEDILANYSPSDKINPVMIPPVPNLPPYIDRYQEGAELSSNNTSNQQRQRDYEAEVVVYKALEGLRGNDVVVIHSLKYTHGDYKLFVGDHLLSSGKNKGKKCSLKDKDKEGECDFVVIGPDFFVIIEVKNVSVDHDAVDDQRSRQCQALTGTFHKSVEQRIKTANLIRSILGVSAVRILQFSAYPYLSDKYRKEFQIEEDLLSTVIFKEDLRTFDYFWGKHVDTKQSPRQTPELQTFAPLYSFMASLQPILSSEQKIIFIVQSVLFLLQSFSPMLGWKSGTPVIDEQDRRTANPEILNQGRHTLIALWCTEKNICNKIKCTLGWNIADINRKLRVGEITFKSKKRDSNPGVVDAPQIVKKFIRIYNLTTEQSRALNSDQRLLWINGPAGSGKTVILSAKIITIAKSNKDNKVVLVKFGGEGNNSTHYQDAFRLANITFELTETYIAIHKPSDLVNLVSLSNSQIFIVIVTGAFVLSRLIETISLFHQYHVFVDDVHSEMWMNGVQEYSDLIETLKKLSANKTVWLACDLIQGNGALKLGINMKKFATMLTESFSSDQIVSLSTNLRNTCDLSDILFHIRDQFIKSDSERSPVFHAILPRQSPGHFIRGPRTMFHVLNHCGVISLSHLLKEEIQKLLTKDTIKENEIAVLYPTLKNTFKSAIKDMLNDLSTNSETEIAFCSIRNSNSAEWPAVLILHKLFRDYEMQLSLLYWAFSRARVYCSVILYPEEGKTIQDSRSLMDLLDKFSNISKNVIWH